MVDFNTLFNKNTSSKTVAQKGKAVISNTKMFLSKEDIKGFKRCVYGKNDTTLYIKLVEKNGKNEKSSAIEEDGGVRINLPKGLGLGFKASKEYTLQPVEGQANTYSIRLA